MQKKEGLSQNRRWLRALDPDYVHIHDHSFEELLAFAANYADLLNFYDSDNKVRGTWRSFLSADLTVVLSLIITTDIKQFEDLYRIEEDAIDRTGDNNTEVLLAHYTSIFELIIEMAKMFDFWINQLRKFTDLRSAFYDELEQAVKSLRDSYALVQQYSLGAEREASLGYELDLNYPTLSSFRLREEPVAEESIYKEGDNIGEKIKYAINHIKPLFDSFYDTLTYIKTIAPKYLEESLTRDNHHPQIGLLLAFLKLFKKAQDNLNSIKPRHMDFYYRDILQQNPREAIPDMTHLCFELSDEVESYSLPPGTRFLADKDEQGNDRVYQANDRVRLNHTKIEELRTLYVSKNKYVDVGSSDRLVSGIFEAHITGDISKQDDLIDEDIAWPTLGEEQVGVSMDGRTMRDATIGFAIATPALQLNEGERKVGIELTFSKGTFASFIEQIKEIAEKKDPYSDDESESTFEEVFFKVFRQAFNISLTAVDGWFKIDKYSVECSHLDFDGQKDTSIEIRFHLSTEDPSIINIDPEVHGQEFDSQWPVVRLLLNKSSFIYPYSLMSELVLGKINVTAEVDEVVDIVVYNNLGQLSIDEPFQPFGPIPKVGSYMLIGSKEVFEKAVDEITLILNWAGLPNYDRGFTDFYRAYEGYSIDNTSFKVNFSLLKEGKWIYPAAVSNKEHFLFQTLRNLSNGSPNPLSSLSKETVLERLNFQEFKLTPKYRAIDKPLVYENTTKSGFIKFELSGDEVMFGHKKYPFLVSDVFLANAKIRKEKNKKEIPNEPYTPLLNSIKLGYKDSKSIKFISQAGIKDESGVGEVFHIMPFRFNRKIYPSINNEPVKLLPTFEEEGTLFIGISDLTPPDSFTLFFHIKGKNVASFEDTTSDLNWYFLADNVWIKLQPSQILSDSTMGLLRSGVITLEIPQTINKRNTILENTCYWIKATGTKNIDVIGDTIEVKTQAATVTWINDSSSDSHIEHYLPPGTISALENPVPEINSITQPIASFGGKLKESTKQFYIRNSERLRHKNRAIVSRDYEQLILDKFPEIYKVNCLQSSSSDSKTAPGEVLIAVIPKIGEKEKLVTTPMANVSLLRDIKEYVQALSSPFVKIEVRNPSYERVRVVCAVRFEKGFNNGSSIRRLNFDLKDFLSPWFFDSVREIQFGNEIHVSDVSGFIQSQPYVDFITKLSLLKVSEYDDKKYHLRDTARATKPIEEGDVLKGSRKWSVLVSARRHHIEVIPEEEVILAEQTGIDDLELGSSFIIE